MEDNTENKQTPSQGFKDNQFKPGQSGNPTGKKPGTLNRKTLFRKYLELAAFPVVDELILKRYGYSLPTDTTADQLAAIMLAKALNGEEAAIAFVLDNALEKIADKTEHSGNMGLAAILQSVSNTPNDLPRKNKGKTECNNSTQASSALPMPQPSEK